MKRSTKVTVENESGLKLTVEVTIDSTIGSGSIDCRMVDASGNTVKEITSSDDIFGMFALVNTRVGELLGVFDSVEGSVN